jgi:hypothetical protein
MVPMVTVVTHFPVLRYSDEKEPAASRGKLGAGEILLFKDQANVCFRWKAATSLKNGALRIPRRMHPPKL